MQAVGAALAGALAELPPADVMTVLAVASVAVTLALTPGLRPTATPAATSRSAAGGSRVRREDAGRRLRR